MVNGPSRRPMWLDQLLDAATDANSWIVNTILMIVIVSSSVLVTLLVGLGVMSVLDMTPSDEIWVLLVVVGVAVPSLVALPPLLFGDALVQKAVEMREDLRIALAQASMASEAKSQFLATMSHEIRTPLNGVIGLTDVLQRSQLDEQQREIVSLIRSSGETLERLMTDVLDASKIEAGKLELVEAPFELAPTIEAAAYLLRGRAEEKGLQFELSISEAARASFIGDAVRLRQIIANLVSNAIKFTETGTVSLEVDAFPQADDRAGIEIVVRDTGIGFSPATAERLFGRFEQADSSISRRFGGTGLGLSICRSLAEMMGGSITASSVEGVGSTFAVIVRLPRAMQDTAIPDPGSSSTTDTDDAPAQPSLSLSVLVAEDNPVNQRVIGMMLGALGAQVTIAADGAEALDLFDGGQFDLILMDMMMPNMDGLAATRAIRTAEQTRRLGPVPIIMLSANAMPDHVRAALDAGCNSHIAKPVTAETLIQGIRAALDTPAVTHARRASGDGAV